MFKYIELLITFLSLSISKPTVIFHSFITINKITFGILEYNDLTHTIIRGNQITESYRCHSDERKVERIAICPRFNLLEDNARDEHEEDYSNEGNNESPKHHISTVRCTASLASSLHADPQWLSETVEQHAHAYGRDEEQRYAEDCVGNDERSSAGWRRRSPKENLDSNDSDVIEAAAISN